ncbi:MAG: hypothetical protein HYZ17_02680 [Betaproteobacteria bacterium]|nr:hypothetical protein [Betaproteobacteria bacterium]
MSQQFTPEEAFDFLQKMWNPLAFGMASVGAPAGLPGMPGLGGPAGILATLDPAEIERKIQELKVVENWLAMNVTLLQTTIKTLELQKVSLEALRAAHAPAAASKAGKAKKA